MCTLTNERRRECCEDVAVLSETTMLVLCRPEKKLYIRKTVPAEQMASLLIVAAQSHPNLPKIIDVYEQEGKTVLLREYIAGETVADRLQSKGCFTAAEIVRLVAGVCEGLSVLHARGLIHRDVTSNNILISADGIPKIIDFGIVRQYRQGEKQDTVIMGTPGYAAPEQFGFAQSDERTDVYATGVLINEMATGGLPSEQLAPGKLGRIVQKCTVILAADRYENILAVKGVLTGVSEKKGSLDRIISAIPGLNSTKKRTVILSAIGYFMAFALTVAAFAETKRTPEALFLQLVSWLLSFPVPLCCFHNFLGIWGRMPFSRGASVRSQKILFYMLATISLLCGLFIFGYLNRSAP